MTIGPMRYHVFMGLMHQSSIKNERNPFHLTYGIRVVVPIEIKELDWRTTNPLPKETNVKAIREESTFWKKRG